jgi:hypothetical protein
LYLEYASKVLSQSTGLGDSNLVKSPPKSFRKKVFLYLDCVGLFAKARIAKVSMPIGIKILATGKYLPKNRVIATDLEKQLGLEMGWIAQKSGVVVRHFVEAETASQKVANLCLNHRHFVRDGIGLFDRCPVYYFG